MYLSRNECARERADYIAEDARERLANIAEMRSAISNAIWAMLKNLRDEALANRLSGGPDVPDEAVRRSMAVIDDELKDMVFAVVSDLEDAEIGEGRHDLAALAEEAAERRADALREERGL